MRYLGPQAQPYAQWAPVVPLMQQRHDHGRPGNTLADRSWLWKLLQLQQELHLPERSSKMPPGIFGPDVD